MLAILLVTRRLRPLGAKDHLCCLLQGCCVFCFNFWCFYTAAAWINTGLESVIFSMAVLFNAINSFLFFRQQPPGRFWAAAALGLAGIVILFWDDLLANGLNASLLWGIGLSATGTYGFARQYVQYSPPAPRAGNADHQQLGDALRHARDGAIASAARR